MKMVCEEKGVGTLVSNQERRAPVVPQMNQGSTAGCVPPFPDMPCMKRVYTDKKASVHWSAARKKERFSSR